MKIGFDFRMGGSINAGIGRYSFELLRHLLSLDTKNHYYIFYNANNYNPVDLAVLETHNNVTIIPTKIRHYSLFEQLLLPRILNKYNLDLIHFPNFNVPIFYRRPFVVTIHDMVHHKISGHKKTHLLHFYAYKKIIEHAARAARQIITVSEHAKQEIIDLLKIPNKKINVIYEGAAITPQPEAFVSEVKNDYQLKRPYFLFVGTLERKKNVITLAHAFSDFISQTHLNLDLVFAGKVDKHYPEIKDYMLTASQKSHFVFTDYVEDNDLQALYQGAYAFVNASIHEGFGLPGVEAMQYGLPLMVSNTPVFNEIYDNAAIYFDPKSKTDIVEKMRLLASDSQFYSQMQQKSLARGVLFDWKKTAVQTLEIYNAVETEDFTTPPQSGEDPNKNLEVKPLSERIEKEE